MFKILENPGKLKSWCLCFERFSASSLISAGAEEPCPSWGVGGVLISLSMIVEPVGG